MRDVHRLYGVLFRPRNSVQTSLSCWPHHPTSLCKQQLLRTQAWFLICVCVFLCGCVRACMCYFWGCRSGTSPTFMFPHVYWEFICINFWNVPNPNENKHNNKGQMICSISNYISSFAEKKHISCWHVGSIKLGLGLIPLLKRSNNDLNIWAVGAWDIWAAGGHHFRRWVMRLGIQDTQVSVQMEPNKT